MVNAGTGGGGGSGSTRLSAKSFQNSDGSIDWVGLVMTLGGAFAMAWGVGLAAVLDAVFALIIGGVNWFAGFGSGLVNEGAGLIIVLGTRAWALSTASIRGLSGIWVPVVVVGLALGYLYLIQGGGD